ncbi:MAG: 5-formyltetrahydrofolate cyclo-ligase [Clostridium sp.]
MKTKKDLRKEILKIRDELNVDEKKCKDKDIFQKLINAKEFKNSNNVFIFVSYKSEVDTHEIIKYCFEIGKKVFVPKVKNSYGDMGAFHINSFNQLKNGYMGILECDETAKEVEKEEIDLVVMPGAVFDLEGGRIGYGGGFYDKFLNDLNSKCFKIALAYDFQILDKIPTEKHDVKPDAIISNEGVIKIL